jgi:hypothetical protein
VSYGPGFNCRQPLSLALAQALVLQGRWSLLRALGHKPQAITKSKQLTLDSHSSLPIVLKLTHMGLTDFPPC